MVRYTGTVAGSGDSNGHMRFTNSCKTPRRLCVAWRGVMRGPVVRSFLFWLKHCHGIHVPDMLKFVVFPQIFGTEKEGEGEILFQQDGDSTPLYPFSTKCQISSSGWWRRNKVVAPTKSTPLVSGFFLWGFIKRLLRKESEVMLAASEN
jgi:hypothetical protein